MHSEKIELPGTSTTDEILAVVQGLNRRGDIHGILVQVPLAAPGREPGAF